MQKEKKLHVQREKWKRKQGDNDMQNDFNFFFNHVSSFFYNECVCVLFLFKRKAIANAADGQ